MGKGKAYRGGERELILKVLTFFEYEKRNGSVLIPIERALDRASEATGVSIRTLRKIKNEAKQPKSVSSLPHTSDDTQNIKNKKNETSEIRKNPDISDEFKLS